jgi:hypothetical protein
MDSIKFKDEVNQYCSLITSCVLRGTTKDIIISSEQQLKSSSSLTGLHHQHDKNEFCEYGQWEHIKKCVQVALNAARRYDNISDDFSINVIIASALLHDIPFKFDLTLTTESKMNKKHALDNAKYIEDKMLQNDCNKYAFILSDTISFHMGKWNDYSDEWYDDFKGDIEENTFIKILREGDYYCSRNDIRIDTNINQCIALITQIKNSKNDKHVNYKTYKSNQIK